MTTRSGVLVLFILLCTVYQLILLTNGFPRRERRSSGNTTEPLLDSSSSTLYRNYTKKDQPSTRILARPYNPNSGKSNYFEEDVNRSSEIVFPDQADDDRLSVRMSATTPCQSGDTYCEDRKDYPKEILDKILSGLNVANKLAFGEDQAPVEIANRNSDDFNEYAFCVGIPKVIYPTKGETRDKKWKTIINQPEGQPYRQGVIVETCSARYKDQECDGLPSDSLPTGTIAICKQKYIYRRLISFDGQIGTDSFLLPSACCCTLKKGLSDIFQFRSSISSTKKKVKRTQTNNKTINN